MSRTRIIDALGRELAIGRPRTRVVSLVPSDTHNIEALGAGTVLVGATDYCEPKQQLARVGGTKDADFERIMALAPDLVVANQEENARPLLEQLAAVTNVYVSMPRTYDEGIAHVAKLARLLGANQQAAKDLLAQGVAVGRQFPATLASVGAAAFIPIWQDPWMTFNADTFGSDMLARAGVRNVFADRLRLYPLAADLGKSASLDATGRDVRYPRVSLAEVAVRQPALVLLPSEPCTFGVEERQALRAALPNARQQDVDGKHLFWYGAASIAALPALHGTFS